jgi:hypothetical protein
MKAAFIAATASVHTHTQQRFGQQRKGSAMSEATTGTDACIEQLSAGAAADSDCNTAAHMFRKRMFSAQPCVGIHWRQLSQQALVE